ncbi:hypothetical protein AMS68_000131 [Peltaster fructicola]|uniref:FAD-binding domain-containing protein n=1 Tax=Peltaster fructicola TaxID=286661 RepID=A0A6H0XIS8_9PEZI|nr:hypothetical protein AMS68_000131 [Peltaster fructicola]
MTTTNTEAEDFTVAIIGGGLCGIALALALTKRSVPYRLYEARSSFTEIGAGINIGPNTLKAFEAIDPFLGDAIYVMCSRNPAPKENVWMQIRYGAKTAKHADYELITELMAPPTGNMAAHRNDLLSLLASRLPQGVASFDKKLVTIDQTDSNVTLDFEDGTSATASVAIACDGIHSSARRAILGLDDPASVPHFVHDGAYRAMIPVRDMQALLGEENGRMSQVLLGPNGYIIMYAVAGGGNMNVGLWFRTPEQWTSKEWVKPHQRSEMLKDFGQWGEVAHKIMDMIPDPSFWATHCHQKQPDHPFVGRVCLTGDSAHSMPPHQGAGAGQAMEDAYVLAEVLSKLDSTENSPSSVRCAFEAFEVIRQTRSQEVLQSSVQAMQFWSDFHDYKKTDEQVAAFTQAAEERFVPLWKHDLIADGRAVQEEYQRRIDGARCSC